MKPGTNHEKALPGRSRFDVNKLCEAATVCLFQIFSAIGLFLARGRSLLVWGFCDIPMNALVKANFFTLVVTLVAGCAQDVLGSSAPSPARASAPIWQHPPVASAEDTSGCLSPAALLTAKDGRSLFVACATANCVLRFDLTTQKVTSRLAVPAPPSGLALAKDGAELFVTCAAPESTVCTIDLARGKTVARIRVGHTATAPVLSSDGNKLMVCNRFNDDVSVIDLKARRELLRIPVQREPVAATLTADGKFLLVANMLPSGPADAGTVAAVVSVIELVAGKVAKELPLPDGSTSLNDIRISPDGRYAVATHLISRFRLPADQVERGGMNVNAVTIIDLEGMKILNTILLDDLESGAANPWGVGWLGSGACLVVAHAGTHEISIIDFPAMLSKVAHLPVVLASPGSGDYGSISRIRADVPNDLSFLVGLRRRIKLPAVDRGPRSVATLGDRVFVGNYFSDTLSILDAAEAAPRIQSIRLSPQMQPSVIRQGELYFHDATICRQGWQSCSSCHPGGARVDGLNWDLPNDGIGNPKNTKSLLLAHRTPPAMSLGVRGTAEAAVRAGLRQILFANPQEEVAVAIDEYLKSLKPVPSPFLIRGNLSKTALRGKRVFDRSGCVVCHPPALFTDLRQHEVGTGRPFDQSGDQFYTPTLIELWRTAPYLHDGSAATVRDVVTTQNPRRQHGRTSNLTRQEIDDLCAYLLAL